MIKYYENQEQVSPLETIKASSASPKSLVHTLMKAFNGSSTLLKPTRALEVEPLELQPGDLALLGEGKSGIDDHIHCANVLKKRRKRMRRHKHKKRLRRNRFKNRK